MTWIKKTRKWEDYPIGTKAKAIGGGHWTKVQNGWKWCTGATFPTPGGDASGEVELPDPGPKNPPYVPNDHQRG